MEREYDKATLKKVQQKELGILKDFQDICKKHDLTYFAMWGTAIGAIRHKGFIPWDDDIDVCLPRADYDKLLHIIDTEWQDKYTVINASKDENYPLMTSRIMLNGTRFQDYSLKGLKCKLGIFLDVYAFDNAPDDEAELKKQARKAFLYNKLMILRLIPYPYLPFGGIKGKLVHAACAVVHGFLVLFRVKNSSLYRKYCAAVQRYKDKETESIAYMGDTDPLIAVYRKDDVFPLKEYDFEDVKLYLPGEADKLLRRQYGDYMVLPPEGQRKNHFPAVLDFGDE